MENNLKWYKEKRKENLARVLLDKEYIFYDVHSLKEAEEKILSLLDREKTVALGDTWELNKEGFRNRLKEYKFFNRFESSLSLGEKEKIKLESLTAETVILEGEFITEKGQIVFVGDYNTSSALFGAESIIVLLSENKIVKDIDAAFSKVDEMEKYYKMRAEKLGNLYEGLGLGIIENGRKFEKRITIVMTTESIGIY